VAVAAVNKGALTARLDAHRRVVLLRAVNTIEKIVVRSDVIELRGRLVVLRGPISAAVNRDGGTAVVAVDQAIGILRIDPQSVMIAVRRVEALESLASVDGPIKPGVGDVHLVRILRVRPNVGEIPRRWRKRWSSLTSDHFAPPSSLRYKPPFRASISAYTTLSSDPETDTPMRPSGPSGSPSPSRRFHVVPSSFEL